MAERDDKILARVCDGARRLEASGQEAVIGLLLYWGFKRKEAYEIEYRLSILAGRSLWLSL